MYLWARKMIIQFVNKFSREVYFLTKLLSNWKYVDLYPNKTSEMVFFLIGSRKQFIIVKDIFIYFL